MTDKGFMPYIMFCLSNIPPKLSKSLVITTSDYMNLASIIEVENFYSKFRLQNVAIRASKAPIGKLKRFFKF